MLNLTPAGSSANILRAESLIGSAFGSSQSETVENPADLEEAKAAYESARKVAAAGQETDVLLGRVEEGLAAISRYQRDKPAVCTHAAASVDHFKKAGVSDFLIEGPRKLGSDYKCKIPE